MITNKWQITWTANNRRCANSLCSTSIPFNVLVCQVRVRFSRHHTDETCQATMGINKTSEVSRSRRLWGCIIYIYYNSNTTLQGSSILGTGKTADSDSGQLALCSPHYQHQYRVLTFPFPCAACASQVRYGRDYTWRCPNPTEITRYNTVDFDRILSSDSTVCKPSYNLHQQVLQQISPSINSYTDSGSQSSSAGRGSSTVK